MLTRLRLLARCAYVSLLVWTGCLWWAKRQLRNNGGIITLAFHRVLNDDAFAKTNSLPGILMKERTFRDLVEYVTRHFEPTRLENANPGESSSKIKIIFTFDDGWVDNYSIVFPIARAHSLPFTVFICPGLCGQVSPFWPEHAHSLLKALHENAHEREIDSEIERLKQVSMADREKYLATLRERALQRHVMPQLSSEDQVLSEAEILEMSNAGVTFGSHTHTHQILTTLPCEAIEAELQRSKCSLEELIAGPCESLAYPNGDWSRQIENIAKEAGFRTALTTQRGAWTKATDKLAIPRSYMCESGTTGWNGRFSPAMFEYKALWLAWRAMRHSRSSSTWVPRFKESAAQS